MPVMGFFEKATPDAIGSIISWTMTAISIGRLSPRWSWYATTPSEWEDARTASIAWATSSGPDTPSTEVNCPAYEIALPSSTLALDRMAYRLPVAVTSNRVPVSV